jgi:hypothetical protein
MPLRLTVPFILCGAMKAPLRVVIFEFFVSGGLPTAVGGRFYINPISGQRILKLIQMRINPVRSKKIPVLIILVMGIFPEA